MVPSKTALMNVIFTRQISRSMSKGYSYASISPEIFQHFLLFLLDRLFSLVFSFNNTEYTLFLILCRIRQNSIFKKRDSGSTQYLRLDCVKMSHSEAIVVMMILLVCSPTWKKYATIYQYLY